MKINRKIKWLAIAAGLTTLTTTITTPVLVSCSSNDQPSKDIPPSKPDTGSNGNDNGNDNINEPDTNNLIVDSFYSDDGSKFIVKIQGKNLSNKFSDYRLENLVDMSLWEFNINNNSTEVTLSRFYEKNFEHYLYDLYYKNNLVTRVDTRVNPNPPQIYENYDYIWNEFGLLIKCKNASVGNLVIPSEITDPVTSKTTKIRIIGTSLFQQDGLFDSITIPEGVEIISTSAFEQCCEKWQPNKVILNIPSSVKIIGNSAFCDNFFSSINFIGNSIKHIGNYAFEANVISGVLDLSKFEFEYLGEAAFGSNNITNFILNSKIDTIPIGLFQYNKLKSIDLSHIKNIGDYAFNGNSISNVDFINSPVKEIGEVAFKNNNLTEVTLRTSVKFAWNTFDKEVTINKI